MQIDYRKRLDETSEKLVSIETSGSNDYYYCVTSYIDDGAVLVLDLKHNDDIKSDLERRFQIICSILPCKNYPHDGKPAKEYKFDMKIDGRQYFGLIIVEMKNDYVAMVYDYRD
jgi:hypothetical protein